MLVLQGQQVARFITCVGGSGKSSLLFLSPCILLQRLHITADALCYTAYTSAAVHISQTKLK